jgi:hypothetical protein
MRLPSGSRNNADVLDRRRPDEGAAAELGQPVQRGVEVVHPHVHRHVRRRAHRAAHDRATDAAAVSTSP